MAFMGILAVIVVLGIPIGLIVALLKLGDLSRRVGRLERELTALSRADGQPRAAAAAPPPAVEEPGPVPVAPEMAATEPTPWEIAASARPADPAPAPADGPVVMTAARASALGTWLQENWVYAVAALSLAFAGIFFVQYGMEKGLLPPAARVLAALAFGAGLVLAGEVVRRRSGDGPKAASAYVPSTFAGAGLVAMFAAVLAARQLYDLIGTGTALGGLVAVAALAIGLGWFYGPFLAAFGLIGAAIAPFAVSSGGSEVEPLFGYFLLLGAIGLAIDAMRRWAWISVLALVVTYAGFALVTAAGGEVGWLGLALGAAPVLALLVPCLKLAPDHDGPMVAEALWARGKAGWPIFPTRLAAGAIAASTLGLTLLPSGTEAESLIAFFALAALGAVLIFWSARARALSDLAAMPVLGFLVRLLLEGLGNAPLARAYGQAAIDLRAAESGAPMTAAVLLGLALALTLVAAWRSGGTEYRPAWGAAAALMAPLTAAGLELTWAPSEVLGPYPWALHVIALAALMAFLAVRFAAADGEADRRRTAYATLSTLSLIALALFLVISTAALTVAISALILVAAGLDRRFRLPEMGYFIQAAVAAISYRLVIDPGLIWAVDDAALWEVLLSFGGAVAAMSGGLRLLTGLNRPAALAFLESGAAASAALLANVLITRWLTLGQSEPWMASHWAATLNAMPWLILALTQLYRLRLGGALNWLRIAIAAVAGLLALAGIGAAALPLNPLFGMLSYSQAQLVHGPYLFDTLLAAYGLPALVLIAAQMRMGHLPRVLRGGMIVAGAALATLYVALEIRRFWQGPDLSVPGVSQYELYSYTVAMMLVGAGLLYQAIARRSTLLRRAALAVIGVTIAKVFLIDASGLTGLTRVFSFLVLGFALIGLAWLDRWAAGQADETRAP